MSAALYGIAAAVAAGLLAGVGWLIRAYIRSQVKIGTAEKGEEAAKETVKRILEDVAINKEVRQRVDGMSDDAVHGELLKWSEEHRTKQ